MNNYLQLLAIRRWFNTLKLPEWIGMLLLSNSLLLLPLMATVHFAFAQAPESGAVKFDHIKTGFILTGAHTQVRCSNCHIQGVYRGTPRNCAGCHIAGGRAKVSAKPTIHIPTTESCENCHRTSSWSPARFNHNSAAPGSCSTCHNGTTAKGKSSTHISTTASCDTCHRTTGWTPATFKHNGIAPGTCATCHNGTTAAGKPSGHISTTASCDTCQRTTGWTPEN